ncbi:MAG: hypothetical protein U0Z26_03690 [Anaerolineales bacterium]
METIIVKTTHPEAIQCSSKILAQGGLVALPTDTVYGIEHWLSTTQRLKAFILPKNALLKKPFLF